MSEELQYELPGLERKAHECESTRPEGPGDATKPDELATTASVYSKLMVSAAKLKATFAAGDREGERIAAAIRAAAGAYQKIEEQKAAELNRQMNGSDAPPPAAEAVVPDMSGIPGPLTIPSMEYPSAAAAADEMDWEAAARIIHSGDTQALSMKYFRDQWRDYQSTLEGHGRHFANPAEGWAGAAAETCAEAQRRLSTWWADMGAECGRLAQEATTFVDAHDKLVANHPTLENVREFEETEWASEWERQNAWAMLQEQSEDALEAYANGSQIQEIRPGKPPSIGGLPAVNDGDVQASPTSAPGGPGGPGSGTPGGGGAGGGGGTPEMPELPSTDPSMSPMSANSAGEEQSSGSPSSGGSSSGGSPSGGSPSGGGAPSGSGMPSGGLPSDMPGGPEIPGLDDPSLKPASAGGGGGGGVGGGGGGMPAAPLGPAVGADSVSPSPSSTRGGGVGVPGGPGGGAGGMMGGGMGGMGAGHGQGQGKEKKRDPKLAPDEELYTEDRAHTEGVIGHRPRREKDSGKQQ
ncbi:type VII secretion system ESX-1 target EspB [Mycolicibacterium smegmatis]|uniref:type VII secretion system ESX-1 target EspB n=1 Tax=Mycolicibacterium smegmatis TaxID=1772 RepID=UPI0020A60643|nr:type VII secretion system ESX-1 target EspB [Mycolicibacterium smegmatis]MCP2627746.1 type VII secretion system ESX-1 target EspB [Mycolicibacterium smegmatis]